MSNSTNYIYVLSILFGLVAIILAYNFFVPKRTDRFEPNNENLTEDNKGLKVLMLLGAELYGALPATKGKAKKQRDTSKLQDLLVRSGNPWGVNPQEFLFLRYVTAIIGGAGGAAFWAALNGFGVSVPWYAVVIISIIIGFAYPYILHKEKATERDLDFKKNLPEALDLIIISISSGKTFNQSLRDAVPHLKDSHLKTELRSVIKSIDSGRTMKEALDIFASRAPSTSIVTFTRSLQEANELNASLEDTLRARSNESRAELFSIIREQTAALPTKMMAVLTPTITMTLLIFLVSPFLSTLMKVLE